MSSLGSPGPSGQSSGGGTVGGGSLRVCRPDLMSTEPGVIGPRVVWIGFGDDASSAGRRTAAISVGTTGSTTIAGAVLPEYTVEPWLIMICLPAQPSKLGPKAAIIVLSRVWFKTTPFPWWSV